MLENYAQLLLHQTPPKNDSLGAFFSWITWLIPPRSKKAKISKSYPTHGRLLPDLDQVGKNVQKSAKKSKKKAEKEKEPLDRA